MSDAILPLPIRAIVCRSSFSSTSWLENPMSRHEVVPPLQPILHQVAHDQRSCVHMLKLSCAFEHQISCPVSRV